MSPRRYKHYLLALLTVILALVYVDRMAFGVALQDIKLDLHLTDAQLGILSGVVFALFFSLAGLPIARWADRGNRVAILSITTAVWSVTVALCGAAGTFTQMLLVRIGTAAGEAGCSPPANSLIPDYFSRAERPRAVARYMLGVGLGLIVGFFAGGWLNQLYGWRMTFILIGLPGLVIAALAALTLKEPRCAASAKSLESTEPTSVDIEVPPSLKEVSAMLWASSTFRHLLMCFLVWYSTGWALGQWLPSFFIRSHGMATGELGTWLAVVIGGATMIGTWLGGEWASRYASQNECKQLAGSAALLVLVAVFGAGALLSPHRYGAFAAVAISQLGAGAINGPLFSTIQSLVPARMRATALALLGTCPIFIGMGFGPWAAGALSDLMHSWAGPESLRYALLAMCPGFLWSAWHLWRASQTANRDLALTLT